MNGWIRQSRTGRALLAAAMLLALVLRMAIPTGFMPSVSAHGVAIQICSETGGKTVLLDLGEKAPGDSRHAADSPCVFASTLGHGLLAAAELLGIQPFVYGMTILVGAAIADLTVHRLAAPPPPSQAPPALS